MEEVGVANVGLWHVRTLMPRRVPHFGTPVRRGVLRFSGGRCAPKLAPLSSLTPVRPGIGSDLPHFVQTMRPERWHGQIAGEVVELAVQKKC
jgi:hypothetical protein